VLRPGMSVTASINTKSAGTTQAPISVSALPRGN